MTTSRQKPAHQPEGIQMNAIATIEPETALPASSSLSLILPEALSFDRWQEIGRELAAREKVLNWWIGDWWAFGEHRYGERADAAVAGIFPLTYGALRNYGSVCRAIATSRRRDSLDWSHHVEIAPLARQSQEAAEMLLERAEREHMTVAQVRAAVRSITGREVEPRPTPDADSEFESHVRSWNRLPDEKKADFRELVEEAEWGLIRL